MANVSNWFFRLAVLYLICGITLGLVMAGSHDHSAFPAHAHLNLLGWVSLFLFGIYYRLNPRLDESRAARIQVGIWSLGVVVMSIGVGLVHTGHQAGDPIAAVGSLVILAGMLFFGWLVWRTERGPARERILAPAE